MGPTIRWGAFAVSLILVVFGGVQLAFAATHDERTMSIVVVPHPDDEFQDWALIERSADEYTVFVSLTYGEETGFCEPDVYSVGLQKELETPPVVIPDGRWSSACERARHSSLLDYLHRMSLTDDTIPGDFGSARISPVLPTDGAELCRTDDGLTQCTDAQRTATTWLDKRNRGAVVFFDLGDGDLSTAEATWAVQRMIDSREALSLDPDLRVGALFGAFANVDQPCYSYPHPDHVAVHDALWRTDFGVGPQVAATCFFDDRQSLTAFVSSESTHAAFAVDPDGTRVGAHTTAYGWLHGSYYPVSWWTQSSLFMRPQSFWVRGNE